MTTCKYHPLNQADYYCQSCNADYCDTCSDETPQAFNQDKERICVRCESSLKELDHTSKIEPFWRNLTSVYLYPLSLSGITVLSIVALIASLIPKAILLIILSSILLISYCLICLYQTANGKMSSPSVSDLMKVKVSLLLKLVFLFFLIGVIINLSDGIFGYDFAALVAIFFMVALPATIILIVIDKRIFNAINPAKLSRVVTVTGASYFFLCLFSFIMLSSLGIINQFLVTDKPSFINYFATSFITAYYIVVIFHLMGYVVYQNYKRLDYPVKSKAKKTNIRPEKKRINDHIETLIKAGDYTKAAKLSEESINENSALWEWKRCFNLMLINNETTKLFPFLDSYLSKLSTHKQRIMISECYLKASKKNPSYQPKDTEIILEIGKSLVKAGYYKNTIVLLKEFQSVSNVPAQLRQAYTLLSKAFNYLDGYEEQAKQFAIKAAKIKL